MKSIGLGRLPIFRSPEQARILTELFVLAHEPLSLKDLADRTGTSAGGVHKEISRLEAAGLVASKRVGRTRLVSANQASPFHDHLRQLLVKAFGPPTLLAESLRVVPGIRRAFIYGSWAASEASPTRSLPRDIDVMVLGDPDVDRVYDAMAVVEAQLGMPVNVSIFTEAEWEQDTSGFAEAVRASPLVELLE